MSRQILAFLIVISGVAARDNRIGLHAVNGKDGKAIANQHVLIFQGKSPEQVKQLGNPVELRTDANGIALLPADIMPWFSVSLDGIVCANQDLRTQPTTVERFRKRAGHHKHVRCNHGKGESERTLRFRP